MNNPLVYLIKVLWHYSNGNRRNFVLHISMSVLANAIASLEPLVVGLFLNTLQVQGLSKQNVYALLGILFLLPVLEIVFWSLHGPSRVLENRNAFFARNNYKTVLLQGTMDLPLEWHTGHHSGDTIDKIEKGTEALFSFSSRTFEVVEGVIALVTSFIVMFFFNWQAGLVALVISLITFYILTLFDKQLVPGYKEVNSMENTISAKVFDALSNVTTVIVLRVEKLVLASLRKFLQAPFVRYDKNNRINEWKWFSASILGRIAVIFVLCIYLLTNASNGGLLVGTIYILYGFANRIRETFFKFAYLYNDIVRYRAQVSNTEELSKDFLGDLQPGGKTMPKSWKNLSINNLSFSYHTKEGQDLHLDSISVDIKNGQRIALVGESGGGKTTFLKILRDLYHPKELELFIDGKRVSLGFNGISSSVSLIPQDPEIFATTIRENITLGVEYSEQDISKFTDMAGFTSVVKRLPHGLDSSIVEKGVNLSGGEKQRLALSRGLLASRDKDVVLLDEPTSSVDFNNELKIYQNIFSSFKDKTIISSIHRLHLLSLFDVVYLFKNGKIIAQGNFEYLKKTSPDFKTLWQKYVKTRDDS